MYRLLQISVLFLTTFFFISCGSDSLAPDPGKSNSEIKPVKIHSVHVVQPDLSPDLRKTLAKVRRATAQYHDVTVAEESGYVHPDVPPHFVTGMGYHYVNFGLMDNAEVIPSQPEALVYQGNPVHEDKRKLGAVEYVIPAGLVESQTDLDNKFPGVDGETWHFDANVGPGGSWTLHVWIWYPNPEGIFHPTNPRVKSGQN